MVGGVVFFPLLSIYSLIESSSLLNFSKKSISSDIVQVDVGIFLYGLVNVVMIEIVGNKKKKVRYLIVNAVNRVEILRDVHKTPSDFMTMFSEIFFSVCFFLLI